MCSFDPSLTFTASASLVLECRQGSHVAHQRQQLVDGGHGALHRLFLRVSFLVVDTGWQRMAEKAKQILQNESFL